MINIITGLPDNVAGVELIGEVVKKEYDQVYPEVEKLSKREGGINYLVVVKTKFSNITLGVWWDDFKLAMKYFSKWNKIAIVTDEEDIRTMANTFDFAYPGEVKTFKISGYQEALAWVSGTKAVAS